jgi:cytochrome P450
MNEAARLTPELELNPYSHEFHNDPYPTYERLREEAPAYYNDKLGFWALSRHEDIEAAFKDWKTFTNKEGVALEAQKETVAKVMSILGMDPPEHNKVRKLLIHVFTARAMDEMEDRVREMARELIDKMLAKQASGEEIDFIEDFAGLLPMDVISDMIGVPAEDRDRVRDWANTMMDRTDGSEEIPQHAMEASTNILVYFHKMVARLREEGLCDDLTAKMMQAEVDGETLSDDEIISFLFLMVVAGNETTTKLLGNALYWGKKHQDQIDTVKADPTKVEQWVEETLRFDNSSQIVYRTITTDKEYYGRTIPKGSRVAMLIGSANRDRRVFENPDQYNIERDCGNTLSFGKGVHFCLGARLARLEGRVCLEELLKRVDDWDYDENRLVRIHNSNVRGFLNMPMTLKAKS